MIVNKILDYNLPQFLVRFILNSYPSAFGCGIKVLSFSKDYSSAKIAIKKGLLSYSISGSHFGGSLFALSEYYSMLLNLRMYYLGYPLYAVDYSSKVNFIKKGLGNIFLDVEIADSVLELINRDISNTGKSKIKFNYAATDTYGDVVVAGERIIYVGIKGDL